MVSQNHMKLMGIARTLEKIAASVRQLSSDNQELPVAPRAESLSIQLTDQSEKLRSFSETSFAPALNPDVSDAQREEAEDMGLMICELCGTVYMPEPSFVNGGHNCGGTGMNPENILPDPSPVRD